MSALAAAPAALDRRDAEFLSRLSHELRTPLNTIVGLSGALLASAREPALVQGLGLIRTAGDGLTRVVEDLLEAALQDTGPAQFAAEPFDLGALADEQAAYYHLLAREKGLAFQFEIEPPARGARLGDERRLRQVISHLLSNALKFTERGSVRLPPGQ